MSRNYEAMVQDALHQRRVNEHTDKPNDFFNVDEEEYRILCMQSYDPFINKREATGAPEEICGLLINRSRFYEEGVLLDRTVHGHRDHNRKR